MRWRAAKVALPPIQRPPRVTPPGLGAVALFGWTLGNRWQRGLIHIWCTACHRDLDWAQPEFCAKYPNPVCGSCAAAKRAAELEVAADANTRWVEAHVVPLPGEVPLVVSQILRGEVPWISTLNPKVIPAVLEGGDE